LPLLVIIPARQHVQVHKLSSSGRGLAPLHKVALWHSALIATLLLMEKEILKLWTLH
jgi:hypothetical protein